MTPKPAAATTPTPAVVPVPATTSTPAAAPPTTAAAIPTTSAAVVSSPAAKPSSSSSSIVTKASSSIASSRVASTSASAASASSSSAASGATSNIGGIVGGVAAGLAVLIAIIFAITYFLRKKRAAQYEKDAFEAGLIDDDTVAKGYNADPSHMAEYNGPTPITYGNMGRSTDNGAGFGSQGGMSSGWNDMAPPPVAFPGQHPFVNGPGSAPFGAPMHNSVPETGASYDPAYNQGQTARQSAQTFSSAASLGRQPSAAAMAAYPGGPPSPGSQHTNYPGIDNNGSPRNSDYVDLSRSSVSPFQAAQYQIISNKLNSPMPTGSEAEAQMAPPPMPSGPMVSPFEDPPPPIARERIHSTPPMLPEISADDHTDLTQQFPVTPSPMGLDAFTDHQQQSIPANAPVDHSHFSATPVKPSFENVPTAPAAPGTRSSAGSNTVRPNTVYDPEDAYGGM